MLVFCLMFGLMIIVPESVSAITETQKDAIAGRCEAIKEDLKNLQHADSRTRVYLGRYYETILNKFIVPMNMRLVENNLSTDKLIENRTDYEKTRTNFMIDYIEYQKVLEDLVATDCKKDVGAFYTKLVKTRQWREIVSKDVMKMRELMAGHVGLIEVVRKKL